MQERIQNLRGMSSSGGNSQGGCPQVERPERKKLLFEWLELGKTSGQGSMVAGDFTLSSEIRTFRQL
jgi:hypothetical protein